MPVQDGSLYVKSSIKTYRKQITDLKWSIKGKNGHTLSIGGCQYGGDLKHISSDWNIFNLNGKLFAPHFRYYHVLKGEVTLGDSLSVDNAAKVAREEYVDGRDSIDTSKDGTVLVFLSEKDVEADLRDLGLFTELEKVEKEKGSPLTEEERLDFGKKWIEQEVILDYMKINGKKKNVK